MFFRMLTYYGNRLVRRLPGHKFDYLLANPPFGVEWKPQADVVEREHEEQGFKGRFGAGLPRINDGSLLFIMHMISKMKPEGSRLAIVFNGSPLFTGAHAIIQCIYSTGFVLTPSTE